MFFQTTYNKPAYRYYSSSCTFASERAIAVKGKNSLFFNAARGRRGRVSFLLYHSTYQARFGEQVSSNLKIFFFINQLSLMHLKKSFCP